MTDHRGFWGAFGLTLLSIGLGGFVSYSIGKAFTTRLVHLGYIPVVCFILIGFGAVMLIALIGVFIHLWLVKRYVTKAMITCDVYFLRARITKDLASDNAERVADLTGSVKQWRDNTMAWLSKHDKTAYARFINSSGFLEREGHLTGSEIDRCLIELDLLLTRLLGISANL